MENKGQGSRFKVFCHILVTFLSLSGQVHPMDSTIKCNTTQENIDKHR